MPLPSTSPRSHKAFCHFCTLNASALITMARLASVAGPCRWHLSRSPRRPQQRARARTRQKHVRTLVYNVMRRTSINPVHTELTWGWLRKIVFLLLKYRMHEELISHILFWINWLAVKMLMEKPKWYHFGYSISINYAAKKKKKKTLPRIKTERVKKKHI